MTKKRITSIFMVVSIVASLFAGSISVSADELPLISAESVSTAILSDSEGIIEEVCASSVVTATEGEEGIINVGIVTEDLKMHKNGENNDGYWTGFSVLAPEGATKMKAALGTSEDISLGETMVVEENIFGENDGIAFYVNAGLANPYKYAKLQWLAEDETPLSAETLFEIDLSNVTLNCPYTPNVQPANIKDNDNAERRVYGEYSVNVEENVINIEMTELAMHKNGENNNGYWTGFSVTAPVNATQMKAALGETEDVELGELISVEDNVFEGNSGIAFYTDVKNPKRFAKLQWFDDAGVALSNVVTFEMNLEDVVTCEIKNSEVSDAKLSDSTVENPVTDIFTDNVVTAEESEGIINVCIATKNLKKHKNANGDEGYWTGFAVVAPECAVNADITFGDDTYSNEPVTIINEQGEKGIAFYVDASDIDCKTQATLKWLDETGAAVCDSVTFKIDLTKTTLDVGYEPIVEKANVADFDGEQSEVYATYDVLVGDGNIIDIDMTELAAHTNANGQEGYWTGFAVDAPDNAVKFKYVFDTKENADWSNASVEESAIAEFYLNAGATEPKVVVMIQWFDENNKALSNVLSYEIDISGVELSGLDKISAETIGDAKIVNQNQTDVNPYSTYSVDTEQGDDYISVAINMTELKSHKNLADTNGYWTGFSVIAPEGATQFKYVFDTEENANWTNAVLVPVETYVSEENDGAAFYTNAGATEPKTVVMLQWFDENGIALSNVTTIKINLNAVSLYREPVRTGSTGGGSTALTVKFDTNGGTKINSVKVYKNEMLIEPAIPEKDGFTFGGWYTDNAFTEKYDFTQKVTKSFTLYAKWLEKNDEFEKTEETDEDTIQFTDIENDAWYYDVVKTAIEKGLMNGISETEFAPMMNLTRGMFLTVLYRAEGQPETENIPLFSDVGADKYYASAVIWATENGIVNGMSETEFMPDENITREQMAAIIARYIEYKGIEVTEGEEVLYSDSDSMSDYAKESVKITKWLGILEGNADGSFAPKRNASRAEAAAVFVRLLAVIQ